MKCLTWRDCAYAGLAWLAGRAAGDPVQSRLFGADIVKVPAVPLEGARIAQDAIPARFHEPAGPGPFPAVILLHGRGGPNVRQADWIRRLNGWGYAALAPDSMAPRGLRTVCARAAQSRLRASVDYYGRCTKPETQGDVPLLALAGDADDWGHPADACRLYGAHLADGRVFEVHTYPGVYHAFDSIGLPRTAIEGHLMEYNAAAAEDSFTRTHMFLDRWVGR